MPENDIKASPEEIEIVHRWAAEHVVKGTTEHSEGTYEEGVNDCIRWLLGEIRTRPDEP